MPSQPVIISKNSPSLTVAPATKQSSMGLELEVPDDRYPGTFFRVPAVPRPGKTTWGLVQ